MLFISMYVYAHLDHSIGNKQLGHSAGSLIMLTYMLLSLPNVV